MVEVKDLSKSFGNPVISNFSKVFPDSGYFVLKGDSGTGKTTFLRILAGLENADSGMVSGIENKRISFVFQDSGLIPELTLKENILSVREKKETDESSANALIAEFGLSGAENLLPSELSGGMALRAAIVRSLYYGGDVFLWDEPFRELDEKNAGTVESAIRKRCGDALFIVVSHTAPSDAAEVFALDKG